MGDPQKNIVKLFGSQPKDSIKDQVKKALSENKMTKEKRQRQIKPSNNSRDGNINKSSAHTTDNIHQENNNGNVIGHVGKLYSQSTKVTKTPPPDTIGAHGHLVKIINDTIKERNINQFDEVLGYFREKLSHAVTGKIKDAMKKSASRTPFYELMRREKELLDKIGIGHKDPEVYAAPKRYYGVSSHKDLHLSKHKDWISRIESIVDKVESGELDPHDIKL